MGIRLQTKFSKAGPFFFTLFVFIQQVSSPGFATTEAGKVVEVNGKKEQVKILRAKDTLKAEVNTVLIDKDITQTGDLSSSKLLIKVPGQDSHVTIYVMENSKFRVEPQFVTKTGTSTLIELTSGFLSVIAHGLKKNEDVRIKTGKTVIGIRGSDITLYATPPQGEDVNVQQQLTVVKANSEYPIGAYTLGGGRDTDYPLFTVPSGKTTTVNIRMMNLNVITIPQDVVSTLSVTVPSERGTASQGGESNPYANVNNWEGGITLISLVAAPVQTTTLHLSPVENWNVTPYTATVEPYTAAQAAAAYSTAGVDAAAYTSGQNSTGSTSTATNSSAGGSCDN